MAFIVSDGTDERAAGRPVGIAQGASWLIAGRLASRSLDLLALAVLAHLLSPQDFGLAALALSIVVIVDTIAEMPLGQSLLQLRTISTEHLDTSFTLGFLRGVALAGILAAAALPFAWMIGEPRVGLLVVVLSSAAVARGLGSPAMIFFARDMNFRNEFWIDATSKCAGTILSIAAALIWQNYWALVIGTLTTPLVSTMLSYGFAPYRPRLRLTRWRDFAHFVKWHFVLQSASAIGWQIDRLILSGRVPVAAIGQYSTASNLGAVPHQALGIPLSRTAWSYISRGHNAREQRSRFLLASNGSLTLLLPAYAGLTILAREITLVILGPEWTLTGQLLSLLCLAAIPTLFTYAFPALAYIRGQPSLPALLKVLDTALTIGVMLAGVVIGGLVGLAVARIAASFIVQGATAAVMASRLGISLADQVRIGWRPVLATCVMAPAVFGLTSYCQATTKTEAIGAIAVGSLAGLVVYGITLLTLWRVSGRPNGIEAFAVARLSSMRKRLSSSAH